MASLIARFFLLERIQRMPIQWQSTQRRGAPVKGAPFTPR